MRGLHFLLSSIWNTTSEQNGFLQPSSLSQVLPISVQNCDVYHQSAPTPSIMHEAKSSATDTHNVDIGDNFWRFPHMTAEMYKNYLKYHMRSSNVFVMSAISIIVYLPIVATRSNFQLFCGYDIFWILSFAFIAMTIIAAAIHILYMLAKYYTRLTGEQDRGNYILSAQNVIALVKNLRLDIGPDMILFFASFTHGFQLIARMRAGQCPQKFNMWESQSCNPEAVCNSIPQDTVILLYMLPLLFPHFFKGCSEWAVMLSHAIGLAFVASAMAFVNAQLQIFTFLFGFVFLLISFEKARSSRVRYLYSEIIKERDMSLQEQTKFAQDEKNRAEMEANQMRLIMGNASHDLKTPVGCIKADVSLVRQYFTASPTEVPKLSKEKCLQIIDSIEATANFMTMTINRNQDFVKATSNIALSPYISSFSLFDELATTLKFVTSSVEDRTITMHTIPSDICAYVISDCQWLMENVMCLLSNAVKYSPRGANVHLRVTLVHPGSLYGMSHVTMANLRKIPSSTIDDPASFPSPPHALPHLPEIPKEFLLVEVEDEGVGISEENKVKLFQPFQQAQRMAGGTGLGLFSLAKRILALNGIYGVRDRNDSRQGTVFWFAFPYRPDPVTAAEASARVAASNTEASLSVKSPGKGIVNSGGASKNILFIDDTFIVLKIAKRTFTDMGYSIVTAENGYEALEILKAKVEEQHQASFPSTTEKSASLGLTDDCNNRAKMAFDVVVTDFQMPVMDGLEFVRRFREFENELIENRTAAQFPKNAYRRQLIVGSTANDNVDLWKNAIDGGMDGVMPKPCTPLALEKFLLDHNLAVQGCSTPYLPT